MQSHTADLTWQAGDVPVSKRFDDPYFSLEDGLAETRHVFLQGNELPQRFKPDFRVAELGFGTGLNFLATAQAWKASGAKGILQFTSFEAYPMTKPDMVKALAVFGSDDLPIRDLIRVWQQQGGQFETISGVSLNVVIGDARETVCQWQDQADAWYLDGFSPPKNPELWTSRLLAEVAAHTAPSGTFATYTAAGAVRRELETAGFSVERVPGYGRKRHMTRGILRA